MKVLVLEERIDAVLRSLAELGTTQLIDMTENLESWEGTLEPYDVPVEVINRCSSILSKVSTIYSKIDSLFQPKEAEISDLPTLTIPILKERSEEVLNEVERRLSGLETKLSAEEENWAKISINLKDRQKLIDKLGTLTGGSDKILREKKLQDMEEQIEASKVHKRELSIIRVAASLEKQKIEMGKLISEIKPMFGKIREDLLSIQETTQREQLVVEAKSQFLRTSKTIYFEAYVRSSHLNEVVDIIKKVSDGDCLVTDERPSPEERIPTTKKLAPSYLIAFEKLVNASGIPSAREVNPISIMAITFPLLFGIMFADVGQGLIFIILGAILTLFKRKIKLEEMGDMQRYAFTSSELFIFMGVFAIFFGFLFGEFFGPSGVIHPISLGKLGPFYFGGFEPTQEPMKMMRFSMFVGVVHLSLGLILRVINEIKKHQYKHVPIAISRLWLLLGGLIMWTYWGGISNINIWFSEGALTFGGLVILPIILIVLFTGRIEGVTEGIGYGVEVFAETLSHTLSYCRLMALGLVHSVMNNLFLVLGGVEHGVFPLSSIPIILIGTILVMIVEGLIVFVHSLRLHWIEWFSKFYSGEGIPFKPFIYNTTKQMRE
ncbi:MAG: V-type ATPase 116kDa subunit family protein [Candidatus Bathyarchaeia archaeon]